MLEFDIKGYSDTSLTPVIYAIQSIWCVIVLFPLIFIIRCWHRFEWCRNIRTAFTLYLSGIDSASRMIFLVYYLLRLLTIYHDGLWMVEYEDGTQTVISTSCRRSNSTGKDCIFQNTISRRNCLTFSLFLYWASTWPMTAVLLLQVHALAASTFPSAYSKFAGLRFCCLTMVFPFCIDLTMGVVAQQELSDSYFFGGAPEILDGCKFEYFSRLSENGGWYVFVLLLSIGSMALIQLGISCVYRRRRKDFVNSVANSPVHGWKQMSKNERRLTTAILICAISSFLLFITHFIVYLVEGNSLLREILSITISVFGFFGPVEGVWFNIDLRKAVFSLLFGEKNCDSGLNGNTDCGSESAHGVQGTEKTEDGDSKDGRNQNGQQ